MTLSSIRKFDYSSYYTKYIIIIYFVVVYFFIMPVEKPTYIGTGFPTDIPKAAPMRRNDWCQCLGTGTYKVQQIKKISRSMYRFDFIPQYLIKEQFIDIFIHQHPIQ